ncbi:hypothetical protein AOLI_G00320710 [Acnodon oligacanthus]
MRSDAVDLGSPDELMEISEVDEGICTQPGAQGGSPPTIVVSNATTAVSGKLMGKGLRRLGGSRSSKEKDKEKEGGTDQPSRKQSGNRAMSENLELLSLKRLTLTSSQSVPKAGTLSLSRTASAVFSRSFEQVSNALAAAAGAQQQPVPPNQVASPTPNHHYFSRENRYSACSLQEEHLSPTQHHQQQQRSPSISLHLAPDV